MKFSCVSLFYTSLHLLPLVRVSSPALTIIKVRYRMESYRCKKTRTPESAVDLTHHNLETKCRKYPSNKELVPPAIPACDEAIDITIKAMNSDIEKVEKNRWRGVVRGRLKKDSPQFGEDRKQGVS